MHSSSALQCFMVPAQRELSFADSDESLGMLRRRSMFQKLSQHENRRVEILSQQVTLATLPKALGVARRGKSQFRESREGLARMPKMLTSGRLLGRVTPRTIRLFAHQEFAPGAMRVRLDLRPHVVRQDLFAAAAQRQGRCEIVRHEVSLQRRGKPIPQLKQGDPRIVIGRRIRNLFDEPRE